MSGRSISIGATLAGGIQDVAALLPIIGTEQCEIHVGSALKGGYLYAAATPLSIFGSLGIVKAGVSILFSSISIPIPQLSTSFCQFKPRIDCRWKQTKWLGARMFSDAGFKLTGTVAPLIGMDGQRFKAETRLLEILEEKHIDNPQKLSVDWKSRQWNAMLILSTLLCVGLSITPYIALFLGPRSWRPDEMHLPWLYPPLRIIGSCFAIMSCQFIIQSRIISLMKLRILFMTIDRQFNMVEKRNLDAWIKDAGLSWDSTLSAEQCIWSLKRHFSSFSQHVHSPTKSENHGPDFAQIPAGTDSGQGVGSSHASTPMANRQLDYNNAPVNGSVAPIPASYPEGLNFNKDTLRHLLKAHFPTPTRDVAFVVFWWFILALSLPVTVVGYIGCFTLVSATPTRANGPLVWVGLEAALSIIRIVVWASNPSFDEETDIRLQVELTEHQPMVTTDDYNPYIMSAHLRKETGVFPLVPQHQFLERITPFTGPLDQFKTTDNVSLYFTLTTDYGQSHDDHVIGFPSAQRESLYLLMTVFDLNMQRGATFLSRGRGFLYYDVVVKYNPVSRQMEANVQSEPRCFYSWKKHDNILFDSLTKYHQYLVGSIARRDRNTIAAILPWKWDLSQDSFSTMYGVADDGLGTMEKLPELTIHDVMYLNRGYEHHLKTTLVEKWSQAIVMDMQILRSHTRNDCYEASSDATNEMGKWELTELDVQILWEWAWREIMLLNLSMELEDILRKKVEYCASVAEYSRKDMQLRMWMSSEFRSGQRQRLEQERANAKRRMEDAMKLGNVQADREGRSWHDAKTFQPCWTDVIEFIDRRWMDGTRYRWGDWNQRGEWMDMENELTIIIQHVEETSKSHNSERHYFLQQFKQRVSHVLWRPQQEAILQMANTIIQRIRAVPPEGGRPSLDVAYRYPVPDTQATAKFVRLLESTSNGQLCSAIVYDALGSDKAVVLDVIAKHTTRSVVNMHREIVSSMPYNDHLFFLSCRDEVGGNYEPSFVQRNRDRWWNSQTTNCSTFYFTPQGVAAGDSCYTQTGTIAHIFVFLTTPSTILVRLLHRGKNVSNLSIRKDGVELATSSNVSLTFKFHDFRGFSLEPGRHELHLVSRVRPGPGNVYHLRDISVLFLKETDDGPIFEIDEGV